MRKFDIGLSLKLMSTLSGVPFSTIYKYVQNNDIHPITTSARRNARYTIPSTRIVMKHFFADKHPIDKEKKKIAQFHFKGGTGKSSLTVETATMLSLLGYKVLVFDGDQQGHLSNTFGLGYSKKYYTFYDCLKNNLTIQDVIINLCEGLDCIPANLSLAYLDELLKEMDEGPRLQALSNQLNPILDQYDFIIFDTAPSITDFNRNIFFVSDVLNVICDTQPQSVQSLTHIWSYLEMFCEKSGKPFPYVSIIPNKYEERVASSSETMSYLQKHWSKYIIPNFAVRKSEDFPRAFLEQSPLSFFCKTNSIAFEDVSEVVRNMVKKCEAK